MTRTRPLQIIHLSAECYPVAKVGGLADVLGALPKYQRNAGLLSSVFMPYYDLALVRAMELHPIAVISFMMGKEELTAEFLSERKIISDNSIYTTNSNTADNPPRAELVLIRINGLLDRDVIYGASDDTPRFLAFQLAVLSWISNWRRLPDIIHCHDHHTGLIPFLMKHAQPFQRLRQIPTVFSIHNAQYQGNFSHDLLPIFPKFDQQHIGLLDWYGQINPMAASIKCAHRVTTVSSSYLKELQDRANGLEGLLRLEHAKCSGILNGIDPEVWNPETDKMLVCRYMVKTMVSGKKANRKNLCREYGLTYYEKQGPALFIFIGRFVYEKAADLLPEVLENCMVQGKEAQFMILGSGDPILATQFEALQKRFPKQLSVHIGYNEMLAHRMYAASDFLIMPSRIEPCGLNQFYAMRYGSIPIVHATGGLRDSIVDIGDQGDGITHLQASVHDISYSIDRAIALHHTSKKFQQIQKSAMQRDDSWNAAAQKYLTLYKSIIPINDD